jgi:oligopeptide transport system substrate-binding protein
MAALCVVLCACSVPEGPSPDGVLRRGITNEPDTLDPHFSRQTEMASLLGDLYEGLLVMSPQGGLQPGVAESWTVSADGLQYTFHLRPEARWSDGSPLLAQVFVDSFRRVVDPATASPHSGMLTTIAGASAIIVGDAGPATLGVRAIDDRELQIELAYPAPYFLSVLTHGATLPVHMPSLAQYGREFTRPGRLVSNGAYTLAERADRQYVELAKNPQYWNSGQIMVDRVRYVPYDSESAQFSAYRAGQLDMTDAVPNSAVELIADSYGGDLVVRPTKDTFYYGFNLRAGALRDAPQMREALSMALQRDIVVSRVTRFGEQAAYSWVPPIFSAYEPAQLPWQDWSSVQRMARAAELMAAGPAATRPRDPLRVLYNTNEGLRLITVAVTSMWREELGIESEIENQEFGVFLQTLGNPASWDVARLSWRADFDDPFAMLEIFLSDSPNNFVGYSDAMYDELVAQSHLETNQAQRMALLRQAERRLLDAHAIAPVYYYVDHVLAKPWIDVGERAFLRPLPTKDVSFR